MTKSRHLLLPAISLIVLSSQAATNPAFETTVQPFLAKNCYGCHSAVVNSGGLDLQSFKNADSVLKTATSGKR